MLEANKGLPSWAWRASFHRGTELHFTTSQPCSKQCCSQQSTASIKGKRFEKRRKDKRVLEGEHRWKGRDKSGTRNVAKLSAKEVPSLPNAAINAAWTKPRTQNCRAVNVTILNQADWQSGEGQLQASSD